MIDKAIRDAAIEEAAALRNALENICTEADRIRSLLPADSYRDGLKEGISRARALAIQALSTPTSGEAS